MPVNVRVVVATAAVAAAVIVVVCETPGCRDNIAGEAVTPAGKPLKPTFTVPENPLLADAVTETDCPLPPAVSESVDGWTVNAKSGGVGTEILNARFCEWTSIPDVPVIDNVAFPAAAVAVALKVNDCGVPAIRLNDAGLALTPFGSPEMETFTAPANPFCAVTETETLAEVPGCIVTLEVLSAMVKSAGAAGELLFPLLPPQPVNSRKQNIPSRMRQSTRTGK